MNYERIYNLFIASRKLIIHVNIYTERHHILPRSLGGSDDEGNIVELTPDDHLFAHMLLAKIYGGKMWSALNFMLSSGKYLGRRSRAIYSAARQMHAKSISGENNPFFGKKHTESTRKRISEKRATQVISDESRKKQGDALRGRKQSAAHILKRVAAVKGKPHTEERKRKIADAARGLMWITDGAQNARVSLGKAPEGWRRGVSPNGIYLSKDQKEIIFSNNCNK